MMKTSQLNRAARDLGIPRKIHVSAVLAVATGMALGHSPAEAGQGYAITGFGGGPDSLYAYHGMLFAPLDSLSASGPQIRLWAKAYEFSYRTDLPAAPSSKIEAFGTNLEAKVGWQFAGEMGRIAFFAGAAWRDHDLSPDDPGSNLEDSKVGLSLTIDSEWKISGRFGIMSYANYLTGFDQYWTQAKPYVATAAGVKIGPEFGISGGDDYQHARAGVFFNGYELPLGALGRVFLGGEAGARFDLKDEDVDPYAGLNAGFLF